VLDLELAGGGALWERLAAMTAELGRGEPLTDVGAVTGATAPEHLARMRELMPRTPFLLPGIGAQGGDVGALAPAFAPGRAAGLVSASRSIAGAGEAARRRPAQAARAEAERLRETAWNSLAALKAACTPLCLPAMAGRSPARFLARSRSWPSCRAV
jgi:orotidine-5'-phosphate decarboxylase